METKNSLKSFFAKLQKKSSGLVSRLMVGSLFLLLVFVLYKFGNIFSVFWAYSWLCAKIVEAGVINIWIARMLAATVAIPFVYSIWFMISTNEKRQFLGMVFLWVTIISYSAIMLKMDKDYYYGASGAPEKCYAMTPSGYEIVPCSWKVHRNYGTPVQALTQEAITALQNKHGSANNFKLFIPDKNTTFFNPDGSPRVWYYLYTNNTVDLFLQPGFHGQLGPSAKLMAINPGVVKKIFSGEYKINRNPKRISSNMYSENDHYSDLIDLKDHLEEIKFQ